MFITMVLFAMTVLLAMSVPSCCGCSISAMVVLSFSGSLSLSIVVRTGAGLGSSCLGMAEYAISPPINATTAIIATAAPFFLLNASQTPAQYLRSIEPQSRKYVLTPEEISC